MSGSSWRRVMMRTVNRFHRFAILVSGGGLGWRMGQMPVIKLTTTGRKSGEPRTTMLTSPWTDGTSYVVVASAGGADNHPAWYLNVCADPVVTVETRAGVANMQATTLVGPEAEALWSTIGERFPHYASYRAKAQREVPLVQLSPVAAASPGVPEPSTSPTTPE